MTEPTATATEPKILDAASILLVDQHGGRARLLMGLRRPDNVFLPNKWVFPGGRLEAADHKVVAATPVHAGDAAALAYGLPVAAPNAIATALALAAVRELYEETGHALALPHDAPHDANRAWPAFAEIKLSPTLAPLRFLARAITPPGRPRRYDTRFFVAHRSDVIEGAGPADGEFSDQNWFTLDEARALDLPNITRRVLADLEICLSASGGPGFGDVPFYYQEGVSYRRDFIPRA